MTGDIRMGKDLKGTELGREIHQRKDRRYEVRIYRNGVSKSFYVKTASEARTLHKKYRLNARVIATRVYHAKYKVF